MPTVFISYSHDSEEHKVRARAFARRLRDDDIHVIVDEDREPGGPDEGWPAWCENQATNADLLLLVVSAQYASCWRGEAPLGMRLGATDETATIRNRIYKAGYYTGFGRLVVFEESDIQHVPERLAGLQCFRGWDDGSYQGLLAWLRGPKRNKEANEAAVDTWPEARPGFAWTLADRTVEFALYQQMVTGHSRERVFLIRGRGNRGKTVLLAEFLNYAQHQGLLRLLIDLKGCPTLNDVYDNVLDLGESMLPHALSTTSQDRGYRLLRDLQNLSVPLVLILDTYEKAPQLVRDWIEGRLISKIATMPHVVVAIGGREVPEAPKHVWNQFARTVELPPIVESAYWLDWNQRVGKCPHLTRDHVEAFTLAFAGDPGLLSAHIETLGLRHRAES